MAREPSELPAIDDAYLDARRAELASALQLPMPGPDASAEERDAWAAVQRSMREVEQAIAGMEQTLRKRRQEESRQRQQRVQWEVVRLRLRRTVNRSLSQTAGQTAGHAAGHALSRQRAAQALMGRVLPSDSHLQTRVQEGEAAEQRRYFSAAMQTWRSVLRYTPPEEALSEARALLEYFSLLSPPRPQDGAQEHLTHTRLQEEARELRGMATGFEQQIAMRASAAAARAAPVREMEEN